MYVCILFSLTILFIQLLCYIFVRISRLFLLLLWNPDICVLVSFIYGAQIVSR